MALLMGGAMEASAQHVLSTTRNGGSSSAINNQHNTTNLQHNALDDSTQSNEPAGIIFDRNEEADSLLATMVYCFPDTRRDVKLHTYRHPSLLPDGVAAHNPIWQMGGIYYADLGALGQSHLALNPYQNWQPTGWLWGMSEPLSLSLSKDVNDIYTRQLHHFRHYQTLRPYTLLRYSSSMNKDYQIGIVHTQNIRPRWNVAFLFDQISREGVYTNSGLKNSLIDFTTNYYSADARYQLQAGLSRQNLYHEENGGLADDTTWWHTNKPAGVPVNMYAAANQWRNLDFYLHQSYNTVRQFEKILPIADPANDSIVGYDTISTATPRLLNTGVLGFDLNISRQNRHFYDKQAGGFLYNFGQTDSTLYLDSTRHLRLSGDLYWSNDAYMQSRWTNPLTVTIGLRPEIDQVRYMGGSMHDIGVGTYGRAVVTLSNMQLAVEGEEVSGGIRAGDYRISGMLSLALGLRSSLRATVKSEAVAPPLLFYHSEGCYNWNFDNDSYRKTKQQQVGINYCFRNNKSQLLHSIDLACHATRLTDNVWFGSAMTPVQGNETGLLLQSELQARLRLGKWLRLDLQEIVQHSSNDNVVRVPAFASRQSLYADLYLFHRALHLQAGADLRYHTRYLADGWNPILGTFYRQDEVAVGNYLVVDLWLTLQVKRASIYLRASHLNAPLEQCPTYFSLLHYPLEDLGIYWGVIWKFFN